MAPKSRHGILRPGKRRRTLKVPAEMESLGDFLVKMHKAMCPRILLKLVYYVALAWPVAEEDLVDSLEVFAGAKQYTEAPHYVTYQYRL
jgi:hypothetical protein